MHDQNFKNLILDYPREALEFFARDEIIDDLSQARIIPIRQEQLKNRLGDRFRELDTPLLVEWPNGKREALLFVLEEESANNRFSIHRLAHYCLDLAELMKTDRVVPVVIFLNTGNRPKTLQLGGDRHLYLEFNYLSCDLNRLSADDYKDSNNIVARLNLPNMDHPRQNRLAIYLAAQLGLIHHESNPDKIRKYIDFIDYYADLTEQELIEYQQHYQTKEGDIMGIVQIWTEQGERIGEKKGEQIGEKKGRQAECITLLTRLLRRKFGLNPEVEQTLQLLPDMAVEKLEDLAEALLDFDTPNDLQSWLQQQ
ncbi:DUF4351 domain-containing protein [Methylomonas rapida]|uniref:DUF4351 domain-containing protein n=1 Tax=Methylomonas rapida TaxID=2963939 RepID=A0ABY7GLJ0_9GAMM|nr:DUF4351 domain-containing protein [Methylomonas rapida]WAR45347.1 DUF4351 domain-containing protein [Methylomonas rapida]